MKLINSSRLSVLILSLGFACAVLPLQSAAQIQVQSRVENMKTIPEGNYLVTLEGDRLMNVEVKNGKATCVKASEPGLKAMQADVQNVQSGVFLIRFRNDNGTMSQVWIFKKDGTAGVRELPDSGELQSAVPVKDDSLTPPPFLSSTSHRSLAEINGSGPLPFGNGGHDLCAD